MIPSTANAKDGTIDVVWYSGTFVPRIDRATGEPHMSKLDMQGCRFDRLNNGAPVFDTHFTGDDFKSLIAGKVGTRAQVGVVRRAWPNGEKGMATLQFDLGDEDGAEMFRNRGGSGWRGCGAPRRFGATAVGGREHSIIGGSSSANSVRSRIRCRIAARRSGSGTSGGLSALMTSVCPGLIGRRRTTSLGIFANASRA